MKTKKASKGLLVKKTAESPEVQPEALNEEIKFKAFLKFENSGRLDGNDLIHWYEAEIELSGKKI